MGEKVYEKIFNEVVEQCRKAGLVKLEQVMVDGSVIKANASIYKMQEQDENKDKDPKDPPPSGHAHSKDGLSVNDFRNVGSVEKRFPTKLILAQPIQKLLYLVKLARIKLCLI